MIHLLKAGAKPVAFRKRKRVIEALSFSSFTSAAAEGQGGDDASAFVDVMEQPLPAQTSKRARRNRNGELASIDN